MRYAILIASCLLVFAGCGDQIGDDCTFDADCSPNLDRTCDQRQPGGYCLVVGSAPSTCPSEASCVEFTTPCADGTDVIDCELISSNRKRTYCLQHCNDDGDCRSDYACTDPIELYGEIIDPEGDQDRVCSPLVSS